MDINVDSLFVSDLLDVPHDELVAQIKQFPESLAVKQSNVLKGVYLLGYDEIENLLSKYSVARGKDLKEYLVDYEANLKSLDANSQAEPQCQFLSDAEVTELLKDVL